MTQKRPAAGMQTRPVVVCKRACIHPKRDLPQTEAEKQRMALGGLVTEVEVLSLTNAQLVLDLHRLRQVLATS